MDSIKRHWYSLPSTVRKPLVLVIGMLFVIAAPFTGVLPGPGGIPVFLIGVAILASEFAWAQRLRDWMLAKVRHFGRWWQANRPFGTLLLAACLGLLAAASVFGYRYFRENF